MYRSKTRFKCPKCNSIIFGSVLETRPEDGGIKRKRECESCGARFITKEKFCCFVTRRAVKE
jgi:transcriptional regulator NrdR family protein